MTPTSQEHPMDSQPETAGKVGQDLGSSSPKSEDTHRAVDGAVLNWPTVTDEWAEMYCGLTGQDPDGKQVTFVDGGVVTSFRDIARREIEAMLCAAPKSDVRQIASQQQGEKAVKVCPQCEGEGSYADGVDEAACSTDCARCDGNGWIVDLYALQQAAVSTAAAPGMEAEGRNEPSKATGANHG